ATGEPLHRETIRPYDQRQPTVTLPTPSAVKQIDHLRTKLAYNHEKLCYPDTHHPLYLLNFQFVTRSGPQRWRLRFWYYLGRAHRWHSQDLDSPRPGVRSFHRRQFLLRQPACWRRLPLAFRRVPFTG